MSEIEFLPCIYNIVNNTILKMTKKKRCSPWYDWVTAIIFYEILV